MKLIAYMLLTVGLLQCGGGEESEIIVCWAPPHCQVEAVVVDLTGLDGCGLVLELTDGTRLIPEKRVYIQAPEREADPLYYFNLKVGQRLKIGYSIQEESLSACGVGPLVFITCISELDELAGQ